jgi:hypothetical protein
MSSRPRLASLATERLAREREAALPPVRSPAAEAAMIDAIAMAITGSARARRRRLYFAGGALAVAASVVVAIGARVWKADPEVVAAPSVAAPTGQMIGQMLGERVVSGVARPVTGAVTVVHDGRELPLEQGGGSVARGDHIVSGADGRATIDLSTGTHVVLERGGDFAVSELGREQRFVLDAGSMQLDVAKLAPGERFLVRTADAEIEVRGTSFRVETNLTPCKGIRTRVVVSEGTVVVRAGAGEDRVSAGVTWPEGCEAASAARASAPATTRSEDGLSAARSPAEALGPPSASREALRPSGALAIAAPRPASGAPAQAGVAAGANGTSPPTAPSVGAASTVAVASTELSEQNRLYGEATAARRRGATLEAVATYEAFLARYPASQLAESAAVERMRLLASTDPGRARVAANDYLSRWPRGFARREATEVAQR